MDVPSPPHAVAALAAFVRDRLTDFSDTLAPAPLFAEDDALLERCFDALAALESLEAGTHPLHPIKRAKMLAHFIDPKETT